MDLLKKNVIFIVMISLALVILISFIFGIRREAVIATIPVGVLFSKTGIMGPSDTPAINATLLAIDEINKKGGIKNKKLVPIVYDPQSNWGLYAKLAERMISKDHVAVIFGCWTSASRKKVKPIVEKYNNLLIYPTQFEGAEDSPNILYLGAVPNQQIIPAVSWMSLHFGKKAFLVGSDYIFPHVANEVLANEIKSIGGTILDTRYIPLNSNNVDDVIHEIIKAHPDVIYNTINGETNVAFFTRLYELTKGQQRPPVMSFSLSEGDMYRIGLEKILGDFTSWSYYPNNDSPENNAFLTAYKKKYGSIVGVNDPAVTAYAGVYLWAQAVKDSPNARPDNIRSFILRQSVASPAGVIYIDAETLNAWRIVRIAKIVPQKVYEIVWSSINPIQPVVYPESKTKAAWDLFEYQLYLKWNKSWENRS